MHPACVGLKCFERPRGVQHIGRTRFRSPCIITSRPRRFCLSTGPYYRLVRSQYLKAAPTKMGHVSTKNGELYDAATLNNEYSLNVPLQVARSYGWLESPFIVSWSLEASGTNSSLEKFDSAAQ